MPHFSESGRKKNAIPQLGIWNKQIKTHVDDPNPAVMLTQNGRQPSNTITTPKLKSAKSNPLKFR